MSLNPYLTALGLAMGLLLSALNVPGAGAASWEVSPSIDVEQEYNSNILFAREAEEDAITRVIPKLKFLGKTERSFLDFHTLVIGEKFWKNNDLDTIDNDTRLGLGHSWTERFDSRLDLNFRKDTVLNTELETAGLLTVRSDRYRYGFDVSNDYLLTERTTLSFGAGAAQTDYPDGTFPDLTYWRVFCSPHYALNPRDTVGLQAEYSFGDYSEFATIRNVLALAYWRRDLTERSFFTLGAGYRYTTVDNDSVFIFPDGEVGSPTQGGSGQTGKSSDDGFVLNLRLNHDWTERFSTVIQVGREQYYTVDVRSSERTYARIGLRYRLTERTAVNCDLGYDMNEETGSGDVDEDYFRIAPYFDWRVTENLHIKLAGSYENVQTETSSEDFDRDRYRAWMVLSYQWPRLWSGN